MNAKKLISILLLVLLLMAGCSSPIEEPATPSTANSSLNLPTVSPSATLAYTGTLTPSSAITPTASVAATVPSTPKQTVVASTPTPQRVAAPTPVPKAPTPAPEPIATPTPVQKTAAPSLATVYWTPNGKTYHSISNCVSLSRSKTILDGSIDDAKNAGKSTPCKNCNK